MALLELFLIGIGLSMDAFAVSVCKGLSMRKLNYTYAFIIAVFFGTFQAMMPFIGWALGKQFENKITSIDHWIAFVLLAFIGGKMLYEAIFKNEDVDVEQTSVLNLRELLVLAIATSIDALAVGITFAFLRVDIYSAITIIGITTFIISAIGVVIGNIFGSKFKNKAEIAGGVILILIGLKILLEHLNVISF